MLLPTLHGPLLRAASTAQQLLMQTVPHGGQRAARRNAWASMSADAAMARARREAAAALAGASAPAAASQVRTAR